MLKTRKRWISLLITVAMLATMLVPMVGPAAAAGTSYSSSQIARVQDDTTNAHLGTALIELDPLAPGQHEAWVSLPSDFEVNDVTISATVNGAAAPAGFTITAVADESDSFSLKINNTTAAALSNVEVLIDFNDVGVPSGASGDIKATFENISGQLLDGSVVIAIVSGGAVKVAVTDSVTFSDAGGQVTLRVEESVAGSLNNDDTLDLTLPDGFEWGTVVPTVLWGATVSGDVVSGNINIAGDGTDELKVNVDTGIKTTSRAAFKLVCDINVSDTDSAEFGDVVGNVKGDYEANVSEITVGTYGDFGATIKADDATLTTYAGMNEQGVTDININEDLAGSLVNGRTITLQLPSNARWVRVNDQYVNPTVLDSDLALDDAVTSTDHGVRLTYGGLQGTDDCTLKLEVDATNNVGSTSAAELTIDNIQVALEAGATGDVVVKVGGSAGLTGDLTLAKVVSPVTVTAEKKDVQIGKYGQVAGDITITEAAAEAIDENGNLTVTLPDDVQFDGTPDVAVTSGDIKIDDFDTGTNANGNESLTIAFKSDSSTASTIKISNIKYAINRVLPEGDVKVKVGGDAIVDTNIEGYYDISLTPDAFDDVSVFFEDSGANATVVNASCVTPAPGEQTGTAVFTIGSTSYTVNGTTATLDAAPYIKVGRTMLPVRALANAVGVSDSNIIWDGANSKVIVMKGDRVITMVIGSNVMYINGGAISLEAAPEIVAGRTMLPLRALAQALSCNLVWDATAQTVTVTF